MFSWMMARVRRGKMKNVLLLVGTIVFCLIIMEVAARIVYTKPGYGYPSELFVEDEITGFRYNPGTETWFLGALYNDVSIRINEKGLRDEDHAYDKEEGKARIIGMGDSVVFGSGVPVEKTVLGELEDDLLGRDYNVEVIKAGVNHFALDQYLYVYRDEMYKYNADVIVVGITLNDAEVTNISEAYARVRGGVDEDGFENMRIMVSKWCRICSFAYNLVEEVDEPSREAYNKAYFNQIYTLWSEGSDEFERAKEVMDELRDAATVDGAKILFMIFPYTNQFSVQGGADKRMPQENILKFCKEEGLNCIDLMDVLDKENYKEYYLFMDNVHLNERGHEVVAEKLVKELIDRGWL